MKTLNDLITDDFVNCRGMFSVLSEITFDNQIKKAFENKKRYEAAFKEVKTIPDLIKFYSRSSTSINFKIVTKASNK